MPRGVLFAVVQVNEDESEEVVQSGFSYTEAIAFMEECEADAAGIPEVAGYLVRECVLEAMRPE